MKLAILLFNMPISKASGSCRFVWQIAEELQNRGIDVTVIANKDGSKSPHNFRLIEVDTPPYGSWTNCLSDKISFTDTVNKYLIALLEANNTYHFDLLHVQHLLFSTLIASLFKDLTCIKFVATCHGTETHESVGRSDMECFFKYANEATLVTSASEVILDDILRLTRFSRKSIAVTYPGVDVSKFKLDSDKRRVVRSNLGFSEKDKILLFAGRLVAEKGVLLVPKIFRDIYQKNKEARLLIVGEGPQKKEAEQALAKLHIDQNLYRFTGLIPQDKMTDYYSASDIFLMPSVWNEPFATTALEAMSNGCLPVFNDIGGVAKMLKKEGFEKLVLSQNKGGFSQKVIELLADEIGSSAICKKLGVLMKDKFTWKSRVTQFINIYEQSIGK